MRGPQWAGIRPPPQLVAQQFQAQTADQARRYPRARLSIIEADGAPVGRLAVGRDEQALRLIDIAILPERQRQGVGAHVIGGLLEEAATLGLPVHLGVTLANGGAERLYRRLGFAAVSRSETDVEMIWTRS